MNFMTLTGVGAATAFLWLLLADDLGAASLASAIAVALAVAFWSHLGAA
jgi:hypothetical protein